MNKNNRFRAVNLFPSCKAARLSLWQCPPFLFVVMGAITIFAMIATYLLASRFVDEPQLAALAVIAVATLFFVFGNLIIAGFNRIAEANLMKEEFISLVSHQLRSPLSIFKWTLDLLGKEIKQSGEQAKMTADSLDTLRRTNENMIKMVNSLLEVNRIEARSFILQEKPYHLEKTTEKILQEFQKYTEAANIKISLQKDVALPAIQGDEERISMVMENLLDNAIRYTKNTSSIIIKISKRNPWLEWSIKDQGIGIPVSQQKLVFQKFFRADNSKPDEPRGSGIGLYLAKAIIEASGGSMGFNSKEKEGSLFWFRLPIK